MRLRLLTLAGLVLACVLVASGSAAAATASAADAHATAAAKKGKRSHHAAKHRHSRKHKRRHHKRKHARRNVPAAPVSSGGAATGSGAGTGTGTAIATSGAGTTTTSAPTAPRTASAPITVTANAASCPGAGAQPTAANVATVRAAVLCLVNQQRATAGVGPLADNPALTAAAQGHSDDMVANRFFDHTNLGGQSPFDRMTAAGYAFTRAAENIAWGGGSLGTPTQIVSGWMNSSGHRANILDGALAESGIGVNPGVPTGGAGGTYTQDFGTR